MTFEELIWIDRLMEGFYRKLCFKAYIYIHILYESIIHCTYMYIEIYSSWLTMDVVTPFPTVTLLFRASERGSLSCFGALSRRPWENRWRKRQVFGWKTTQFERKKTQLNHPPPCFWLQHFRLKPWCRSCLWHLDILDNRVGYMYLHVLIQYAKGIDWLAWSWFYSQHSRFMIHGYFFSGKNYNIISNHAMYTSYFYWQMET